MLRVMITVIASGIALGSLCRNLMEPLEITCQNCLRMLTVVDTHGRFNAHCLENIAQLGNRFLMWRRAISRHCGM